MIEILRRLEPDIHLANIERFYHFGIKDLRQVLAIYKEKYKIETYLEIGVRRGYSMAIIAADSDVNIVGIDPWIADYAGVPNPGVDFIRKQMKRVNHTGSLTLYSADSKTVVPVLPFKFDMITVDGDHSFEGAITDLRNCINLFNYCILLDDIDIDPDVIRAWQTIQIEYPDLKYTELDMVGVIER